ncbi:MAG: hypothetical protein NTV51_12465, partial [Verrucomicrobia bacterium]|nr:hypothetical protein [Verrucomicrobiota bacterium]
ASWQIVPSNYQGAFTTQAQVPTLSVSGGKIVAGPPMRSVTVALVGLHVVGVVANHPEFIWATFEQRLNAPNLPANVSPTSATPVYTGTSPTYTFYQTGTPANQCNLPNATLTLNATAQTLSPVTQVFRQFADGSGTTANTSAIDALNASVHAQLKDVWNNYDLIGGVWLLPGVLAPNLGPQPSDLHGSPQLANSTMETFAQAANGFNSSCFTCHTTQATQTDGGLNIPAMNMNLSHTFTDGLITQELARRKLKAK